MKNLKKSILLLFICGVFGDEVKKVSVMEGESVTLSPDLTDIQKYWLISWKIGDELIAQISEDKISYKNGSDGSFRNRLQLDSKTASLTITNMRMKHSGLYKLDAVSSSSSLSTSKKFTVSVYESPSAIHVVEAEMKSVSVTPGESLTLQTDVLHPRDELIVWRFGDEEKLIAKADLEANINSYIDIDERFRDRLTLDKTGSLTINNMRITDSGLYLVKISSSKQTLHKRFSVTVSGLSSGAVAGIVVVVLLVISAAAAVVVVFYYRWKESEQKRHLLRISTELSKIILKLTRLPEIIEYLKMRYEEKIAEELNERYHKISDYYSKIYEKLEILLNIAADLKQVYEVKIAEELNERYEAEIYEELRKRLDIATRLSEEAEELKMRLKIYEELRKRLNIAADLKQVLKIAEELNERYEAEIYEELRKRSVEVSVKEGETARLKTGLENQQTMNLLWRFGDKQSPLVEIKRGADLIIYDDVLDGRFKGRLDLDKKTGDLTINNTNTGDSGEYIVWIMRITNKTTIVMFVVSVSGSAGEVTGKKPIELKADSTENGASESTTVVMPLLSK